MQDATALLYALALVQSMKTRGAPREVVNQLGDIMCPCRVCVNAREQLHQARAVYGRKEKYGHS